VLSVALENVGVSVEKVVAGDVVAGVEGHGRGGRLSVDAAFYLGKSIRG